MCRRTLLLSCAALLAASSACLSAGFKATAPELYALDPPLARGAAGEAAPVAIVVATPRAVPGLESRGIVYVVRAHELHYFAHSAWVDPPARMLEPLLARALEANGAFRVARDAVTDAPARLRLETDLLRLQQEFTERPSQVRLVLRVRLVDTVSRRVLGDREIEVVERARQDDPYGGVVAANAAAARAVFETASACEGWARGTSTAAAHP